MLGFLQKLTLTPTETTGADVAVLRAIGLPDAAIEEALYVALCFNIIDRLADAFDFAIPADNFKADSKFLFRVGYRAGSLPG